MNSRIVYPAPSFQPPETCTEHRECQQGQASNADLCRMTLEHYEKVSRAAHEWNSAIPKAIALYYADPERARLERVVIEAAKAWKQKADDGDNEKWSRHYVAMCEAIDALIDFESSQQQIKK